MSIIDGHKYVTDWWVVHLPGGPARRRWVRTEDGWDYEDEDIDPATDGWDYEPALAPTRAPP